MAVSRVLETKKGKRQLYSNMGDAGGEYMGEQEYEYQTLSGWKSDVTGQFYAADPMYSYDFGDGRTGVNGQYEQAMNTNISNIETQFTIAQEDARLKADLERRREEQRQAQEAQRVEFARQTEEARAEAARVKQQYETEAQSRAQAKADAEAKAAKELGDQQAIQSQSMNEDAARVAGVRDGLVAAEDKKVLTTEDKTAMFNGDVVEDVKSKNKALLEKLLAK